MCLWSITKGIDGEPDVWGGGEKKQLDDEWPESIFHHVGSQSASYPVSVQ